MELTHGCGPRTSLQGGQPSVFGPCGRPPKSGESVSCAPGSHHVPSAWSQLLALAHTPAPGPGTPLPGAECPPGPAGTFWTLSSSKLDSNPCFLPHGKVICPPQDCCHVARGGSLTLPSAQALWALLLLDHMFSSQPRWLSRPCTWPLNMTPP